MIIRQKATIIKDSPSVALSIAPAGNESFVQTYDQASGDYIPDYTLVPLILVPTILVGGTKVTDVESQSWWIVNSDGTQTQVTSGSMGLQLYPAGFPNGLRVARNISSSYPLKLIYRCKVSGVTDSAMITLRTDTVGRPTPMLELDFPETSVWNPFVTDRDKITIHPTVRSFGQSGLTTVWMKVDGNTVRALDPTDPKDAELAIDSSTNALTIDRRWMGEKISLFCRLMDGTTKLREIPVTIRRRIPDFNASIRMSDRFYLNDTSLYAEAMIELKSEGRIADPSKELLITFYDGNTKVGSGNSHSYPIVKGAQSINAAMDIEDRGPMKLLTYQGKYLSYNGKLLGGR